MTFASVAQYAISSFFVSGLALSLGAQSPKPTIVLVHGAFADGSSWQHLIPLLEHDGYPVIAVQNPLSSLSDDITTTKRVIDAQAGPVIVVGHSYGGAVITAAAAQNAHIKGLVYIAAFAPEVNETVGAFGDRYPAPLNAALKPDAAGFLYVDRAQFHAQVAADIPEAEARVMAATQKPVNSTVFAASVDRAAWKTVPSWYVVTANDHAINPDLERFYAKRMHATVTEVKSSHVPFISHPRAVADVIERAAASVK
jgi:pimeloyl-ACP methyl ester carboxylesterase